MKRIKGILIICGVFLLSYLSLNMLNQWDNKYKNNQAPIQNGVLDLDEISFVDNQLYSLVDYWDYYNHAYLQEESQDIEKSSIYLGQYPDYSMRDEQQDPYGISTYHLRLTSSEKRSLSLFIPEVDSAYELWIDQELVLKNGDIQKEPMESFVKNRSIQLTVNGSVDLYFNVGNDAFYYSGLYFPPVLSTIDGIQTMVREKLIFYAFLCFSTLSIACYSIGLWMKKRKEPLYLAFGVAALSFAFYISMELWRFVGFSYIRLAYAGNDLCYFIMLACILYMNAILSGMDKKPRYRYGIALVSMLICILVVCAPFLFPDMNSMGLRMYGDIIDVYKYLSIAFILYTSFLGFQKQNNIYSWILAANCFDVIGIFYTLWSRNSFEPMTYGWPNEYFAYIVILLFTFFMIHRNHQIIVENEQLTMHLQTMVEKRTQQLETLLNERKVLLSELTHDVKAPLSSIHSLVDVIQMGNVQIDDEVQNYLSVIKQKSDEVNQRMKELHHFSKSDAIVIQRHRFAIQEFLQHFYDSNKPDCDAYAIHFNLDMEEQFAYVYGNEEQLLRVFENLLFNALDFTPSNGHIQITQTSTSKEITISFMDDGIGISQEHIESIFHQGISYCRDQKEEHGLGLYIARSIMLQHGGQMHAESDEEHGTTFIIQLPKEFDN